MSSYDSTGRDNNPGKGDNTNDSYYSCLFKNNHSVMLLIDPQTGEVIDANPAACHFYGYSLDEMLKLKISEINTLTEEQVLTEMQAAKAENRNRFFFKHKLANGEIRDVEVYSGPIVVEDRELLYSIIHDITERKRAEAEIVRMNAELESKVIERTCQLEEINSRLAETNAVLEEEISERMKVEEHLQELLDEVEDLYHNSPCGYHSVGKDGVFIRINDTELKWLGYTRDEVVGKKKFSDVISPESVYVYKKNFQSFKELGWINDLEFTLVCKDGSHLPVLLSATAIRDDSGEYLMSRSTIHDISERKRVEEELQSLNLQLESMVMERTVQLEEANSELEEINAMLEEEIMERTKTEAELNREMSFISALLESMLDGVAACDADGRLVLTNRTAREWLGIETPCANTDELNPQGTLFRTDRITALPADEIPLAKAYNGEIVYETGTILHPVEQVPRYIMSNGCPFYDEKGNKLGAVVIMRDITEIKKVADELKAAKEDAEKANLAKSKFLANMSHEIRTPMNGIIGMTDLTLMTDLSEEQRQNLAIIKSSTVSLLRILNDILDYSKMEAGRMDLIKQPFNVYCIVREVVGLFEISAREKGLYINYSIDDRIPEAVVGDSVRLRQVLSNLVGNGVKFTSNGGIAIDVTAEQIIDNSMKLKFSISDTGIGISDANLDRLFRRFSQVDDSNTRQFGGTGLGLAISKRLVEMMGGEISVESREGSGSKFYFSAVFDIVAEATGKTDGGNVMEFDELKRQEPKKILLAEDDEVSRKLASIFLKKKGYNVIIAENGKAALDLIGKTAFDLVLMDINMPLLDGYSATAVIRQWEKRTGEHIPIIAMTAYALTGDREKCLDAGMDDYISKPVDITKLISVIDRWLSRKENQG